MFVQVVNDLNSLKQDFVFESWELRKHGWRAASKNETRDFRLVPIANMLNQLQSYYPKHGIFQQTNNSRNQSQEYQLH